MIRSSSIAKGLGITILTLFTALAFRPSSAVAQNELEVLFVGQQTIDNQNCIAITFSLPLDGRRDFNRFVQIFSEDQGAVEGAWVLTDKGDGAYFSNIEAHTKYEVLIRKGLQAANGQVLADSSSHKVKTRKVQAFISFASKGYILPAKLAAGIPVHTMNVKQADIDFFRVKDRHIVDFLKEYDGRSKLYHYDADALQQYSKLVHSARFDLAAQKNVRTQVLLPIGKIKALAQPGIYLAALRQAGTYPYAIAFTYFSISDIGLHLRVYPQQMDLLAQHLTTGKIFRGVDLQIQDKKGRVIAQGRSDQEGRASFANLTQKAWVLVARNDDHTSILPLKVPALDLSAFDLGDQTFRNLELFVYGPRDLYRPGETVILDGLLRDYDGRQVTHTAPIEVTLKQPDGQRARQFSWHSGPLNAFHYEYGLSAGAQTGTWTAEYKLAGNLIQLYQFKVEDFMPERMKLILDEGDAEVTRMGAEDTIAMAVEGAYLYGAPAAGNRVGCRVSMVLQRLLLEELPGFEFGHVDEKVQSDFETDDIELNDQGRGVISVPNQWQSVRSPLKIRLHTSLYESGGRPVSRSKVYHLWPAEHLVGVRPLWEGEQPDGDSVVEFEVIRTNPDGDLLAAKGLAVTLIREYPDYYWEYSESTGWERIVNYQHYPVNRFDLDIQAGQKALINFPVEWGPYRLEIKDPVSGLVTAHRFSAGWSWWGRGADQQGSRPDQVVLTLDKAAYRPGDVARLLIKAPEAGTALVMVEGDRPLWRQMVEVKASGTEMKIPVAGDWDRHDLHVSAMVIRPGDRRRKIAPKRALGIIHLPLERKERRLAVTIAAPAKSRPNETLHVDISVDRPAGQGDIYLTLAAVDVGVLSITQFETPDPAEHFFNRRRYGVDHFDIYQKIIEGHEGDLARHRFGGDAALEMTRGGDKPMTDVQIVSLYQGAVKLGADGKARVDLDLPDFNGRLRLMAVAYSDRRYGSAEREVTVAAPVVAEIAMPRFLAMGDEAFIALDVQNLSGQDQELTVALKAGKPIVLTARAEHQLSLKDKAKTTLRFPIRATHAVGAGDIDLRVDGIRLEDSGPPIAMQRQWRLGTRPAYPAVTRQWRKSLAPGERLTIEAQELEGLLPATVQARLTLTDQPPINLADHIKALYAYPYGCLEQTTSGIYPQVLINNAVLEKLKIKGQPAELRRKKVARGIDRIMTLQKPNGGFGLWSNASPEECWLTAYATDFLISARDRGYDVPADALGNAAQRLNTYLRKPRAIPVRYTEDKKHYRLAVQSYSGFVLARLGKAPLGTLRTLYDNHQEESRSGLPLVHLGLALYLQGDDKRAEKAFREALVRSRKAHTYLGDYGSPLRDAAFSYYLLGIHAPGRGRADAWLVKLEEALYERRWLSTQERNALVLAGMQMLKGSGKQWHAQVRLNNAAQSIQADHMVQRGYTYEKLAHGVQIEAMGDTTVYVHFLLNGYGRKPPAPEDHDMEISRTFYNLQGHEIDPRKMKTGDLMLVRLDVQTERRVPNALVVDLLPAGVELENQNLSTSFIIDPIEVEGKTIQAWRADMHLAHEEFRDDRYVAAIDARHYSPSTLFYLVRAVTPGKFQVPNAYVEDMYRPYMRSLGKTIDAIVIEQP